MKQIYILKIIFCCLIFVGSANADTPKILLTVDKLFALPGQTFAFNATVSNSSITEIYLSDSNSIEIKDNIPPYQWIIEVPDQASGSKTFQTFAILNGNLETSNKITVTVTVTVIPDSSTLRQIFFEPSYPILMSQGNTEQLLVKGRFTDGYNREITEQVLGTIYTENIVNLLTITAGDSPAISISEDGLVTALQPGIAEVVATNNGISNVRRIQVVAEY